ncbi:hypothetical protein NC651_004782 [Populus alba x Populus x berolinensis]|nr:hypothetical protein NC651_004782 [Populus alba x Populus x berolinensis]
MDPLIPLEERSRLFKSDKKPIVEGIEPTRILDLSCKSFRFVKFPISKGMDPLIALRERIKDLNLANLPNVRGIGPGGHFRDYYDP